MFEITHIKVDVSDSSVGVLDDPARDEVVQIIRNCTEGNRFISRLLVNFPSLRKGGTEWCLRLRIRAREL